MRGLIARIRVKANNKLINSKNKLKNNISKLKNNIKVFKEKVNEEKKRPRSKVKSYFLGFGTALSIFGVTFFAKSLPANASDVPASTPGQIAPAPVPGKSSDEIVATLTGVAASLCGIAVSSGSFLVGIACGVVVAVGILKAQGK